MTYNLHPLLVHFPIAMLFVYSVVTVAPLKAWFPSFAWKDASRVLLAVGVLGAFAALATGDTAEQLVRPDHALVDMHANFAAAATFLYGALLAGELAAMINAKGCAYGARWQWVKAVLVGIERVFCNPAFSCALAACGFVAIVVTGVLGGVMAYGLTADPLAPIVLKLLGLAVQ
jgi:uncharacterized membrane protein